MVKYSEASWCVSQTKLLDLKASGSKERHSFCKTENDYCHGQQIQCQVHYLNKPKRANRNMAMSTSGVVSPNKIAKNETVKKPALYQNLITVCDDKPNLCEEMNYSIATSPKKKKCGCVYRHQACRIHMYHCDSSFSSSKSSFVLPTQLNVNSEVHREALNSNHSGMELLNKTCFQHCNSAATRFSSFQYTPMHNFNLGSHCSFPKTYQIPPKNKMQPSNSECNVTYGEIKQSFQTSVKHRRLIEKPKQLIKFARKRAHENCGLQVSKKHKVDLNNVCQLQVVPEPKQLSFEAYSLALTNYLTKRMLAIRIASMYPKVGSEVQSKSEFYCIKLPQSVMDLLTQEVFFFNCSKDDFSTNSDIITGNVSSQNFFYIKHPHHQNELCPPETSPGTGFNTPTIENGDKQQHEENKVGTHSKSSRKSKRLKRKRDLGIQGPYQTDYVVEIPSVKKNKKQCVPYGKNCFWNFYDFFHQTQKRKWKNECYKYLKVLTKLPHIKRPPGPENDIESVLQKFVIITDSTSCGGSEHKKDETSSNICSFCCLPFDGMSDFEKSHHINRHQGNKINTLVAPVTFLRKSKQMKRNNQHGKTNEESSLDKNMDMVNHDKIKRPQLNKSFYKAEQHILAQKYAYWSFQSAKCYPLQYNPYKRATARKSRI
uniref:Uncharacterized protein LOC108949822 n=1 Tax=Phallusia mammillata TaxID=59560 RepID=A0A6F9DIM4_9ASCI|nr:uncharacterized protein LOC108949822 [Phallusia mammillata]